MLLAEPGATLETAGETMSSQVGEAADSLAGLPAIGDDLCRPFDVLAEAGADLAGAGVHQQEVRVGPVGCRLLVALAVVLVSWLPWRLRWVLRVRAASRLLVAAADPALSLALGDDHLVNVWATTRPVAASSVTRYHDQLVASIFAVDTDPTPTSASGEMSDVGNSAGHTTRRRLSMHRSLRKLPAAAV